MHQKIEHAYQEYLNLMTICEDESLSIVDPELKDSTASLLATMKRGVETLHDVFLHHMESRKKLKKVMTPVFEDSLFKEVNTELEDLMSNYDEETQSRHLDYLNKKIEGLMKFKECRFESSKLKD